MNRPLLLSFFILPNVLVKILWSRRSAGQKDKKRFFWNLVHMIMEPKKFHDMLSATQRTRKAHDRIQSELKTPKQRILIVEGRRRWMSQLKDKETERQRGRENLPVSFNFILLETQWIEWSPLIMVRVHLLTQPIDSNAYFVKKCPQRNTQNFHQLSGNS